tara:strand:- start:6334 stop:7101 length:768 start_codon:yes stop_codon:yes gene_type:complete
MVSPVSDNAEAIVQRDRINTLKQRLERAEAEIRKYEKLKELIDGQETQYRSKKNGQIYIRPYADFEPYEEVLVIVVAVHLTPQVLSCDNTDKNQCGICKDCGVTCQERTTRCLKCAEDHRHVDEERVAMPDRKVVKTVVIPYKDGHAVKFEDDTDIIDVFSKKSRADAISRYVNAYLVKKAEGLKPHITLHSISMATSCEPGEPQVPLLKFYDHDIDKVTEPGFVISSLGDLEMPGVWEDLYGMAERYFTKLRVT